VEDDIHWHFIGGLQSNKAKMLVNSVKGLYMVESVDSQKLATTLDKACEAAKRDVLRSWCRSTRARRRGRMQRP